MKFNNFSFCCLIFAFVIACSATDEQPGVKNDNDPKSEVPAVVNTDSSSTTTGSSISSTTSAPTTHPTSAPTTHPTSAPTTHSTSAPTTHPTSAPTTHPTLAPTAPTSPPTTQPTTAPTTQPSTKPVPTSTTPPTPVDDIWRVGDSNSTCILMKSRVELQVSYFANATSKQINTTTVVVPSNVTVSGSCGDKNSSSQYLVVLWEEHANQTNHINFTFTKSGENKCDYFLKSIEAAIFLNVTNDKNITSESFNFTFSGKLFEAHDGISYTCTSPAPVKLNGTNNSTAELHLSSLHYEAYHHKNDNKFSSPQDCVRTETPDFVPILVASALILLVILVLAAYVITRRRSQSRGYLSM